VQTDAAYSGGSQTAARWDRVIDVNVGQSVVRVDGSQMWIRRSRPPRIGVRDGPEWTFGAGAQQSRAVEQADPEAGRSGAAAAVFRPQKQVVRQRIDM